MMVAAVTRLRYLSRYSYESIKVYSYKQNSQQTGGDITLLHLAYRISCLAYRLSSVAGAYPRSTLTSAGVSLAQSARLGNCPITACRSLVYLDNVKVCCSKRLSVTLQVLMTWTLGVRPGPLFTSWSNTYVGHDEFPWIISISVSSARLGYTIDHAKIIRRVPIKNQGAWKEKEESRPGLPILSHSESPL